MSDTKKSRNMSPKGFLHKSQSSKVSPAAFLAAHREWLTTGELSETTSPILARMDAGTLMPTPCLAEIQQAVLHHHLIQESRKAEAAMNKAEEPAQRKPYIVTVYDAKGNICTKTTEEGDEKDLVSDFPDFIKAQGWADRRLYEGAPDWFAVVQNTLLIKEGEAHSTTIMRNDSIGRLDRAKGGPATRKVGKTSSTLSSKMRVKGDHFHFSKG